MNAAPVVNSAAPKENAPTQSVRVVITATILGRMTPVTGAVPRSAREESLLLNPGGRPWSRRLSQRQLVAYIKSRKAYFKVVDNDHE